MCQRADKKELEAQNMRNSKLKIRNSKSTSLQPAFTLVEVLIVVAILTLVAAGLLGVSNYIHTQSNVTLTKHCLELLSKAVADFHDITGHYPIDAWPATDDWDAQDSGKYIYLGCRIRYATENGGPPNSDELLYLQLSLLPQTRQIIAKLPEKLLAAPGSAVQLAGQSSNTRYLRSIVDPWGNALNYALVYYDSDGIPPAEDPDVTFPDLSSNGPDGDPGTEDDISNKD